jgi:hypothetical protein
MRTKMIHVQYARIVHQLILEDIHGAADQGHESLRRRTYAQTVLDFFGQELDRSRGPAAQFRSKVFTPILQRQLKGVSDAYAPSIAKAINPPDGEPTISQVTTFYLGNDPLDPISIPSFRRNLVYIREARWHLGILMKKVSVKSVEEFERSLHHQDVIAQGLKGSPRPPTRGIPPFNEIEVAAIVEEGIEDFFERELLLTVRHIVQSP